jgi:hypothetical protein
MLMDTILHDVPMPKVFVASTIRKDRTYRIVIDGQQRISAILDFLRDAFVLEEPYSGPEIGKTFTQLDREAKDKFLSYKIDFNEAINPTDEEVREVYSRVNKYTVPLNRQELRRADFPGDFLTVSEELAVDPYFDDIKLFTPANRRRYAYVEYVSELLCGLIGGIQDKKTSLDEFYTRYAHWDKEDRKRIVATFHGVIRELRIIFNNDLDITETRFVQKADFYSIFLVMAEFVAAGRTAAQKGLLPLQEDLRMLDYHIRPESEVPICSEYAIKCVSQANSASSRRWRHTFLMAIFSGTYIGGQPNKEASQIFYGIMEAISVDSSGMCPDPTFECPICDGEIIGNIDECVLAWNRSETVNQIYNACWMHRSCMEHQTDWLVLERPDDGQPALF